MATAGSGESILLRRTYSRSGRATAQAEGWEREYGEAYSPHFPGMMKAGDGWGDE